MDGIQAAKHIKSKFDIPVVYLTAHADKDTLEKAKVTEPFGYIVKPFNDRDLRSTIEMAIYKHSMDKKLREREAWLSTILSSIGDGVVATDKGGLVIFMNEMAERLSGWNQSMARGRPLSEVLKIIYEETGEEISTPTPDSIYEKDVFRLPENTILIDKNGNRIAIDTSVAPLMGGSGDVIGLVMVLRDITLRKRAEEALRISEERYRGLFETMDQGVLYYDASKKITACNPAAEKILGIKSIDMIGMSLSDSKFQAVREDGTIFPVEEHPVSISFKTKRAVTNVIIGIKTPDSDTKWLLVSSTPVFDKDTTTVGSVFTTFTDITRQKSLEIDLKRINSQLNSINLIARELSKTLDLKTVMSKAVEEALKLGEFESCVMFVFNENEPGSDIHVEKGMKRREVEFFQKMQHDRSSAYSKSLYKGKADRFLLRELLRGDVVDEKIVNKYCLLIPIHAGNTTIGSINLIGEAQHLNGEFDLKFFTSIGRQIGLAVRNAGSYEKINDTLEKLRVTQDKLVRSEKLASLGQLAAKIVHEIGNSLGAIINSIQVLKKQTDFHGKMKELVEIISSESGRLNRMVDQLREFSKPRKLNLIPTNLTDIVKKAIFVLNQDFELIWGKKIVTRLDRTVPEVLVDPDAMEQVALNLIKNGLQAIGEGGEVRVSVITRRSRERKHIELIFEDNGPGIPNDNIEKIFEPYFSTKSQGIGLGLHIVKQIVEAHKGTIEVRNRVRGGTKIVVSIPY